MDKKSKYTQQPASKAATADAKKNQDASSKPFPRSSRRRESPSANNYPKNDLSRKPNPQKTRNFDKRPKPKGHYSGNSKENSKVVDDESAELGSVMAPGSKKQNLNHLLNFHYAPREVQGRWNHGRSGYSSHNYNRWLPPVQRHKYNKEQFLQANCQFVVTANGDYSLYLNDPDALVDWKLIQQIRVRSSDNLSCPICLCPPVAGKMTRCGHVYCWPCILHYLALSDKSWRKCPICYESVHKTDLKSVVEIAENIVNIGDHISLRLMRREKGTLIALPVHETEGASPQTFLTVAENSCQQVYSKLLLAQNSDIMDIIEWERTQLNMELLEDPHSPENCFIEQALAELIIREQDLLNSVSPVDHDDKTEANLNNDCKGFENQSKFEMPETDKVIEAVNKNEVVAPLLDNACMMDQAQNVVNLLTNDADNATVNQKFHYFYQVEGGQNVYLHAMNVKMLEMQYGSLEKSPLTISGKLMEKEVGSFTEELRKRMRYLCHLPVTSQIEIVEIDLQPPTVSEEVVDHFKKQINSRKEKRERRERSERKRERKITEEENKLMGKYPTPNVHIESRKHFPQFQSENAEFNTPSPPESVAASSMASSPSISSFDEMISDVGADINQWSMSADQNRSFAQMLRTSGSRRQVWPSLNNSQGSEPIVSTSDSNANADPEMQEFMAPAYSQSLGDALAQALEKSKLMNEASGSVDNETSSKKKKKKNKATLLFATNMARAS